MTTEAPSIVEQYATAVADGLSENRMILAAGMSRGPGAMYARLRQEWDDAHATIPQTIPAVDRRMLTAMKLKSLPEAKRTLEAAALAKLDRLGLDDLADAAIKNLVWLSLSAWLEPQCHACEGRGHSGGYDGKPSMTCMRCKASGSLLKTLGKGRAQESLCAELVSDLDTAVGQFKSQARAKIHG